MKLVMNRMLRYLFPNRSAQYRAFKHLIANEDSYLHTTGWLRSIDEGRPVNDEGLPIPWINYAASGFISNRLSTDHNVFEFGSGNSTGFLAERVQHVTSVEGDAEWYAEVSQNPPANVTLIYQAHDVDGHYCRSISETSSRFDVVLVDGRDRVNCMREGASCLTDRGVLILDDSDRERYSEGLELLDSLGFASIFFDGLKPTHAHPSRTTVFYRPGNCLRI